MKLIRKAIYILFIKEIFPIQMEISWVKDRNDKKWSHWIETGIYNA